MQNNDLKKLTTSLVAIALLLGANLGFAAKPTPVDLAKKELRSVPTAEMPAKAASMVAQAKTDAAETTTETVVTAALEIRSAAAVAVVSAIARQNNQLAPAAAAKAASLRPKDAALFARAAAGAAPEQAAQVAFSVCKAVPTQYAAVATAVAQAVPDASKQILAAVTTAVPALSPFVERVTSRNESLPMGMIMAQTEQLVKGTAVAAKVPVEQILSPAPSATVVAALPPPGFGPPFTPALGSPTELIHTNTVEIPSGGGRNYFGP